MNKPLSLSSDINIIIQEKLYLPVFSIILFAFFTSLTLLIGIAAELYVYVLAFITALPLLYLTIRYPKFWIYVIALSNIVFFYDRGKDVSAIEVILALEYLGSLIVWLVWTLAIKREKLIHNIADFFVLFFAVLILFNSIIALTNGVELMMWGREAANLILVLLYFPIRKYFIEKKDLLVLLFIYAIVVTVSAFLHFWTYSQALSNADLKYAYELVRGIRVNQTLFTSAAMIGFIYALYQKSLTKSLILVAFTVISIGGLITSFSRTFWLVLVVGLFIIVFYLSAKQRLKLLFYSSFVAIALFASAIFIFEDKASIVLKLIEQRFVSSTKGTKDVSVQARLEEYDAVIDEIKKYPMAGTGLAKKFSFYNFLEQRTTTTSFVHNGYLFIIMKLGIPLAILCFIPYFIFLIKGERLARKVDDEFYRLLALGGFMSVALMIISNITAAQIIQREATFVTALSFAFIGIVIDKYGHKIKKKDAIH